MQIGNFFYILSHITYFFGANQSFKAFQTAPETAELEEVAVVVADGGTTGGRDVVVYIVTGKGAGIKLGVKAGVGVGFIAEENPILKYESL